MDTAYLKQCLGDSLTKCLAEVSEKRPRDPIEYIAQWLYKFVENQQQIAAKKAEVAELERQIKEEEKESVLREKRREEAKRIAEKEAEKKRQEEERAKKEVTSLAKLPVVMEAQEPSEEAKAESARLGAQKDKEVEEAAQEDIGEEPREEESKGEDEPEPEATEEPPAE